MIFGGVCHRHLPAELTSKKLEFLELENHTQGREGSRAHLPYLLLGPLGRARREFLPLTLVKN